MSAPTWSPCTLTPATATATADEAWLERAVRAVAQGLLGWVARQAVQRRQRARRQRVRRARQARLTQRRQARALQWALARQLSPHLRRDMGW